jgi:type II secretory pathway component GspD/PulD (secretin)
MEGGDVQSLAEQFGQGALPLGWALSASLGGLLGLKFDVLSKLGAAFGARLQASLAESSSRVWADTSLTALSGQEARLQNTSTYRYVETAGQEGTAGVTREIASGIILSVAGTMTGSGDILVSLNATVSERAAGDSGPQASGPPETSERLVSAKFRARPGTPIAITGLSLRKEQRYRSRPPLLGGIPLLGALFGTAARRNEESSMSIFVLPRVLEDEEEGAACLGELWRAVRSSSGSRP